MTSGLPLGRYGLSPSIITRAAERADMTAQLVQRGLEALIIAPNFPALLILDRGLACILKDVKYPGQKPGRDTQTRRVLVPEDTQLIVEYPETPGQVQAVAFGQGPGAFTGLRTACAVAQGLALGLDKPVLALDTLMAVAEHARQTQAELADILATEPETLLWVLQDARMSEVYAAAYRLDPVRGWEQAAAPVLWPLDHLRAQVETGVVRCAAGSALSAYPEVVVGLAGPASAQAQPRGEALAALALAAWSRGDTLDAALALPLYVRDKVAQTTQERREAALAPVAGGLA